MGCHALVLVPSRFWDWNLNSYLGGSGGRAAAEDPDAQMETPQQRLLAQLRLTPDAVSCAGMVGSPEHLTTHFLRAGV